MDLASLVAGLVGQSGIQMNSRVCLGYLQYRTNEDICSNILINFPLLVVYSVFLSVIRIDRHKNFLFQALVRASQLLAIVQFVELNTQKVMNLICKLLSAILNEYACMCQ